MSIASADIGSVGPSQPKMYSKLKAKIIGMLKKEQSNIERNIYWIDKTIEGKPNNLFIFYCEHIIYYIYITSISNFILLGWGYSSLHKLNDEDRDP